MEVIVFKNLKPRVKLKIVPSGSMIIIIIIKTIMIITIIIIIIIK